MGTGTATTSQRILAFGETLFNPTTTPPGTVISGSIAVLKNSAGAIREATISLLTTLLETHHLHHNDIIAALFITDLTADYPARTARELPGWHAVPMLCAQESRPPAREQNNLAIILFASAHPETSEPNQPRLRGIRGATILENDSDAEICRATRWLFEHMLTRNKLRQEDLIGAVISITPDLGAADALLLVQELTNQALPLLLHEIDVPTAPKPCIRLLCIAEMIEQPQPVYSKQALHLLRPDLMQQAALSRPHSLRIVPFGPLSGAVTVPASKYHTLRAILAAVLAEGMSVIHAPALSDDTTVLLHACAALGASINTIQHDNGECSLHIRGTSGQFTSTTPLRIDVGNAGMVLRLLLGVCALSPAEVTFSTPYPESLGRRPNDDLLEALVQLGVRIKRQGPGGTLPITIQGGRLRGGRVRLSGQKSSQYLSALLYLGPLLEDGLEIEIIDRLVSASFIDLTIQMLQHAGVRVITEAPERRYRIPGKQHYTSQEYRIPGDYPSAAALLAAIAVAGGEVTLSELDLTDAGVTALLAAFSALGVDLTRCGKNGMSLTARAQKPLRGLTFDGNQAIDSVPSLVAAACFASTPSHIFHIAHLRFKESDRIYDLARALCALGCQISPSADALNILPASRIRGGAAVDAHSDHRLAQALAIAALGCEQPVTVRNAQHVAKSYPRFFDDLASLGARIEEIG